MRRLRAPSARNWPTPGPAGSAARTASTPSSGTVVSAASMPPGSSGWGAAAAVSGLGGILALLRDLVVDGDQADDLVFLGPRWHLDLHRVAFLVVEEAASDGRRRG